MKLHEQQQTSKATEKKDTIGLLYISKRHYLNSHSAKDQTKKIPFRKTEWDLKF
jgi:hypothetical protein